MVNACTLQPKYNLQASLWIAQELSAETTQSAIQKLAVQHREVHIYDTDLHLYIDLHIYVPLKTQHWAYSRMENKQTA